MCAEPPDPGLRLGYFHPLEWLRLIGPLKQTRPNAWPMHPSVAVRPASVVELRDSLEIPKTSEPIELMLISAAAAVAGWLSEHTKTKR
jgi:hypothetical protein